MLGFISLSRFSLWGCTSLGCPTALYLFFAEFRLVLVPFHYPAKTLYLNMEKLTPSQWIAELKWMVVESSWTGTIAGTGIMLLLDLEFAF